VVLTADDYHRSRSDTILVALTTNMANHYGDCLLDDWRSAGLPLPTKAKAFVQTIERSTIDRRLGTLSEADFTRLKGNLRTVLGL
jgi:mRNA-degrading endonuclease toxin of MazEF toxin-antitoxin module